MLPLEQLSLPCLTQQPAATLPTTPEARRGMPCLELHVGNLHVWLEEYVVSVLKDMMPLSLMECKDKASRLSYVSPCARSPLAGLLRVLRRLIRTSGRVRAVGRRRETKRWPLPEWCLLQQQHVVYDDADAVRAEIDWRGILTG